MLITGWDNFVAKVMNKQPPPPFFLNIYPF